MCLDLCLASVEELRLFANLEGAGERDRDLELSLVRFSSSYDVIFPLLRLPTFLVADVSVFGLLSSSA